MIKFNNVTKIFNSDFLSRPFVALDQVQFEIPEGSMVGFLGANGAGKTTSLKIIMDFIRPSSGYVEFSSRLGVNKMDVFRHIGFLPERPYFYPNLTGKDFLKFMGQLSGITLSEVDVGIAQWAERFKIDYALSRELKTYSKGMLQRIGFLATILHHPKIIILDEPLSGLDPIGRKELKDVIVEVHKSGKTVFFSSHIVSDIEEICDRVIFLKEGKLVYDGSVMNLLQSSKDQSYLISAQLPRDYLIKTPVTEKINLPDDLQRLSVESLFKDKLLLELLENNFNITSIELKRPSLEEIFYSTKDQR